MPLYITTVCLTSRCLYLRIEDKPRGSTRQGNAGRTNTFGPGSSSHDEGNTPRSDERDSGRDSEGAHDGSLELVLTFTKTRAGEISSRLRPYLYSSVRADFEPPHSLLKNHRSMRGMRQPHVPRGLARLIARIPSRVVANLTPTHHD